ncbi:MAG: YkgJ family cysteine cluster protein [Candidatus Omnitrophica bacterium]|nr:YkgJ family cysteine cluster protein [Candidatus Omnitrophota bacterium]
MIKQLVPGEFCLNECRCCCKFSQEKSIWSPALLNEEIEGLLKNNIPPSILSENKKIRLIAFPQKSCDLPSHVEDIFICPFLNPKDSKCKIYTLRPFECQIYPFLINRRKEKIFLAVDLGCAFIKKNLDSQEFKEYVRYLEEFFNNTTEIARLKNNPQLIQAYDEASDLLELKV